MSDRKITIVNGANYASPAVYTPGSGNSRRIEPIRYYFGLIHTIGPDGTLTYKPSNYNQPIDITHNQYRGGAQNLQVDISEPDLFLRPGSVIDPLSPLWSKSVVETREDITVRIADTSEAVVQAGGADVQRASSLLREALVQSLNQSGIGSISPGAVYYDHSFEVPMATSIQRPSESPRSLYYNITPEYSYHSKFYEETIGKSGGGATGVYEAYLPNLYSFVLEAKSSFRDQNAFRQYEASLFGRLISLNKAIPDVFIDEIRGGQKVAENEEGEYFKKYAAAVHRIMANPTFDISINPLFNAATLSTGLMPPVVYEETATGRRAYPTLSAYKTTLFPTNMTVTMKEVYDKRNLFPMHNLIEFKADTSMKLVRFLSEVGVNDLILAKTFTDAQSETMVQNIQTGFIDNSVIGFGINAFTDIATVSYHDFNIDNLKDEYFSIDFEAESDSLSFEGVYYSELGRKALDDTIEDPLSKAILGAITTAKVKEIYKTYQRSYTEILEGKSAHREVMGYKIKKFLLDGGDGDTLVTTIIIPNAPDMDVMRYVDTQVKYDTNYRYDVEQMVLVFGSKMEFVKGAPEHGDHALDTWQLSRIPGDGQPLWEGRASVIVSPSLRIYEVPYFSKTVRVTDDPPAPPELTFIPYKGVDNKVLINVNNSFGEYVADPISFNDEQEKQYADKSFAQNLENGLVRFVGDDTAENFILYRTRIRPRNYLSFADSELVTLSTSIRGLQGDASSYVDSILPNVKYYYTARTVDVHGNLSNPTSVFEVEMVSDGDIIYPIIRDIEFVESDPRRPTRPLKKFLQVKPAYIQTIHGGVLTGEEGEEQVLTPLQDFESADDIANGVGSLTLGASGEGLWGRSFKLRMTSKQTGRKIDLNMTFRLLNDQ